MRVGDLLALKLNGDVIDHALVIEVFPSLGSCYIEANKMGLQHIQLGNKNVEVISEAG